MTTREGGAQPREYLAKYAADRVRNASSVWLGATLGCAECHDHKFDPYKTKEFYSFAAFFADIQETAVGMQQRTRVPVSKLDAELKQLDETLGGLRKKLAAPSSRIAAARAQWEKKERDRLAAQRHGWVAAKPARVVSRGGATMKTLKD